MIMKKILTKKEFYEQYTWWWYWDVDEDYEKYLIHHNNLEKLNNI